MVTTPNYISAGQYMGAKEFRGLSTDSKPASCGNGSVFIEMDSGKIYFYDAAGEQWIEWGAGS